MRGLSAGVYAMWFRRYSLPFRQPVRTAHGAWARREGVVVRLSDHRGATGLGEAAPIPWFGTETAGEAAAACARLGARVSREQIEAIPERLGCLRFALASARAECAAAGAAAAAGGAVAGGVGVSGFEGGRDVCMMVAALLPAGRAAPGVAARRAEAGFRSFKWKVGAADAGDEWALLDDVLAALPAGARLRLDANGAWDRRTAERWLGRCAGLPVVEFVEQPVAAAPPAERETGAGARSRAMDLLLGLAGDFPVPLALDEAVAGARDVSRWLDAGWPGLFVLKPALLGDVAGTLRRLRAAAGGGGARAGGRDGGRVVFSSALETVVGARAALGWALRWAAEIPNPNPQVPGPESQVPNPQKIPHPKSQIPTGGGVGGGVAGARRNLQTWRSPVGGAAGRAAGFGVWPLFEDARFDGPDAAPSVSARDIRRLDGEAAWNALG
jgi:O-succinylbenzoate synthase